MAGISIDSCDEGNELIEYVILFCALAFALSIRKSYEKRKLAGDATAAEQSARYVSLAYALGPAPDFEAPARSIDLPSGLLEVLDFAPLVREFYRKSGIGERMPSYLRLYQAEADRLRAPTAEM